jgi:hypothetical protein
VFEVCDVCGETIERDFYYATSRDPPASAWFGVCGCADRKWRWRSTTTTGEGPWDLIGPIS